jgi:hypothetical protein
MNEQLENVGGGKTLAEPELEQKVAVVVFYALALFGALGVSKIIPILLSLLLVGLGLTMVSLLVKNTSWEEPRLSFWEELKSRSPFIGATLLFCAALYFAGYHKNADLPAWAPSPIGFCWDWFFLGQAYFQWRWVRKLHTATGRKA